MTMVCTQCFNVAVEYGELIPGFFLASISVPYRHGKTTRKLVVVGAGGHRDDVVLTLARTPYAASPEAARRPGETEAEYDKRYDELPQEVVYEDLNRIEHARETMGKWPVGPDNALEFTDAVRAAGYDRDRDGDVSIWLWERCCKLMADVRENGA